MDLHSQSMVDTERTGLGSTAGPPNRTLSAFLAGGFLLVGLWSAVDGRLAETVNQADTVPTPPTLEEAALQDQGMRALAWENLMTILRLEANQLGRAKWDSINAARRAASFEENQ